MRPPRPFALLRTRDQWSRCSHFGTEIDATSRGVELARLDDRESKPGPPAGPAGLAFDHECRLYRSIPDEGRVERQLWSAHDPLGPLVPEAEPMNLLEGPPVPAGDFVPAGPAPPPLRTPRGLAVDCDDRLFVAETDAGRILVYDLWNRRLLNRIGLLLPSDPTALPLDLAAREDVVWCVLANGELLRLAARSLPVRVELRGRPDLPADARPSRLAVSPGGLLVVLCIDGMGRGWLLPQSGRLAFPPVERATDVEFRTDGSVVVARHPGDDFACFQIDGTAVIGDAPLKARGYDGAGIVRTPDGRIGFWTDNGLREAVVARSRFVNEGRVATYRLDSGEFHTEWGRVFLDACVPAGCDLHVVCTTADDVSAEPTIAHNPPPNVDAPIPRLDLSPPLVPLSLAPLPNDEGLPLHRRETGRELPWARFEEDDPFETYEAPVYAPPGRYLWLTLLLRGTGRATPRVRCLRAEHPAHDLLRRLPKTYSRDERVAAFLRRYLMLFDGALGDLEGRAEARAILLDPYATPEEALPWLASFLGLTLDERWPAPTRRELIDEIPKLWRQRGTIAGISRFLELYLQRKPVIVEHFRVRGLGGALLGDKTSSPFAGTIVGANLRVGGAVGERGDQPISGNTKTAFDTHAHRFSVLVPATLDADDVEVVRDVLEAHRPAHTIVTVCTASAGMRVGIGLHVELLSVIGRTGGFETLRLGATRVGRTGIVGRPAPGARLGLEALERGLRVG
jgi:phage tail-like protein